MSTRLNGRTLTAMLLIVGAVMLQGCACANAPNPACGGHGYVAPVNDRGGGGGGNGGGGMM
jgi:hypothetical protein